MGFGVLVVLVQTSILLIVPLDTLREHMWSFFVLGIGFGTRHRRIWHEPRFDTCHFNWQVSLMLLSTRRFMPLFQPCLRTELKWDLLVRKREQKNVITCYRIRLLWQGYYYSYCFYGCINVFLFWNDFNFNLPIAFRFVQSASTALLFFLNSRIDLVPAILLLSVPLIIGYLSYFLLDLCVAPVDNTVKKSEQYDNL